MFPCLKFIYIYLVLFKSKKVPKEAAEISIIDAPDVRLYVYENHKPASVNTVAMIPEIIIMLSSEFESFSAMYTGMVSIAMTSMSPTTFMAITTVSADSIKIKV